MRRKVLLDAATIIAFAQAEDGDLELETADAGMASLENPYMRLLAERVG